MSQYNDAMVEQLKEAFVLNRDVLYQASLMASLPFVLPGVRAYFPFSVHGPSMLSAGQNLVDVVNNSYLFSFNSPPYAYDIDRPFAPYATFNGSNQVFWHTDASNNGQFAITGAETYVASANRGFSWSIWIYPTSLATSQVITSKYFTATNERSYVFSFNTTGKMILTFSSAGTANNISAITHTTALTLNAWNHIVVTFKPSTHVRLYLNGQLDMEYTAVTIASIHGNTSAIAIGALVSANTPTFSGHFTGRLRQAIYADQYWNSAIALALYEAGRILHL